MPTELLINGSGFSFIGWMDDHLSFYVLDEAKRKMVIEPKLPSIENTAWRDGYHFPKSVPTRIEPARLIPPPYRPSKQAAEHVPDDIATRFLRPWEIIYGEVLYPKPEHEEELKRRHTRYLEEQQIRKNAALEDLNDVRRKRDREHDRRLILQTYDGGGPNALYRVGSLNVTFEIFQSKDVDDICSQYLAECWAKERGADLETMEKEKLQFLKFAGKHRVSSNPNSSSSRSPWIAALLSSNKEEKEQMALLASVRCVMEFGDEEPIYLAGARQRDLQTAQEIDEFRLQMEEQASPNAGNNDNLHDSKTAKQSKVAKQKQRVMSIKGRLEYSPKCDFVRFRGKPYDLSKRPRAQFCLRYLTHEQAFTELDARHLATEIDVYVKENCPPNPESKSEVKIDHYFNDRKGKLSKLRKELIFNVPRTGKYYLKVD